LKQQLVRVLIKEIVVNVDDERDEVRLLIQWSGGHHTELRGPRTSRRSKLSSSDMKAVIETLRKVHSDSAISRALNRAGIHTSNGKTWTCDQVTRYRRRKGIRAFEANEKQTAGWLTQSETATRLEISPMSVHRLVRTGILPAEQPHVGLLMVIRTTDLLLPELGRAVKSLKAGHARPLPNDPNQLNLF
jgi:hypothetical protein